MNWNTRITEMIGSAYPIILGAFAGFDNSRLTGAISDAGGFGVLTASAYKNKDEFQSAIGNVKKITKEPFGVNFSSPEDIKSGHIFYDFVDIAKDEGIKTLITAASRIEKFGKYIKDSGQNWIHKATIMKHAISGERMGADAVILTGLEGGGLKNPKQNTFLINLENVKKYIKVPFIASGGISTGKSLLAALILGADAVHICTAFLATTESPISEKWKQRIIKTDCFDPDFIQKVCHFETPNPKYTDMSMSVGTISKKISARELINNIINEAEELLKSFKSIK
ncbi:MAG: nitronate monooxygenase [Promethearchaeota archaeon]|nr:MAG: nitronate monooxygenase [Candidatus Lokiarchaeota archaeon]